MSKNFIQNLLSDDEGRKLYFREDLMFEVTEAICKVMQEQGMNKAELARRSGVTKSNITQLLSGDHNMTLVTISDLLFALGFKLQVSAVPLDIDQVFGLASTTQNQEWIPVQKDYSATNPQRTSGIRQVA